MSAANVSAFKGKPTEAGGVRAKRRRLVDPREIASVRINGSNFTTPRKLLSAGEEPGVALVTLSTADDYEATVVLSVGLNRRGWYARVEHEAHGGRVKVAYVPLTFTREGNVTEAVGGAA